MTTQTIELQEPHTPLKELVARVVAGAEIVLLEGGAPVARLVPIAPRMPDLHPGSIWTSDDFDEPLSDEFLAEVDAYEQLKPELLKQYPGRVVAIYHGQVVEVGDDEMEVLARVQERLGEVPCYVGWVEPDAPRRVRLPSVWIAKA